jgi:hypothetical protein
MANECRTSLNGEIVLRVRDSCFVVVVVCNVTVNDSASCRVMSKIQIVSFHPASEEKRVWLISLSLCRYRKIGGLNQVIE